MSRAEMIHRAVEGAVLHFYPSPIFPTRHTYLNVLVQNLALAPDFRATWFFERVRHEFSRISAQYEQRENEALGSGLK